MKHEQPSTLITMFSHYSSVGERHEPTPPPPPHHLFITIQLAGDALGSSTSSMAMSVLGGESGTGALFIINNGWHHEYGNMSPAREPASQGGWEVLACRRHYQS